MSSEQAATLEEPTTVNEETVEKVTGAITQLFQTPRLAKDRMPLLNVIFENMDAGCEETLKDICLAPSSFEFEGFDVVPAASAVKDCEGRLAAIFYCQRWGNQMLVMLDRPLLSTLTDAMFGGEGKDIYAESEEPFSPLEMRIGEDFGRVITQYFKDAFKDISPTDVVFDRVETEIEVSIFGKAELPYVMAKYKFEVMEHVGNVLVMLPQGPLFAVRDKLQSNLQASTPRSDTIWKDSFRDGVMQTPVLLEAAVDGPSLSLQQLASLQIGSIIELPLNCHEQVQLSCGEEALFQCRLGKANGHFTVGLDQALGSAAEVVKETLENTPSF